MDGPRDGMMRGWGWIRTKKYGFLSIILSRNAFYIGRNPVESVLENFIFHDFKIFFEDLGIWCRDGHLRNPSDLFFCTRKMGRSRSSDGVGRSPAACYVGGCIIQVGCTTFWDLSGAPKNFKLDDLFFCTLFPLSSSQFSGEALKSVFT